MCNVLGLGVILSSYSDFGVESVGLRICSCKPSQALGLSWAEHRISRNQTSRAPKARIPETAINPKSSTPGPQNCTVMP